jgi:hypothetical protein
MAKAPTTLERIQWDGENVAEVQRFLGDQCLGATPVLELVVTTPDGATDVVTIRPDGWLVRNGSNIHVEAQSDARFTAEDREPAAGRPPLESIVDSFAYEGGFD